MIVLNAQVGFTQESTLEDDHLLFQTTPPSTLGANYGLNGVTLNNGFGLGMFTSGLLQVGDDLILAKLEGPKLTLTEAAIIPARTTELDKEHLIFHTKGTGQSLEEWKIGRDADANSPPQSDFIISRETVGISGGATFANALLISSGLDVAIGSITPSEKLDVDGNARFRSIGTAGSANDLRVTATGVLTTSASDIRLKQDIEIIDHALQKVIGLQGVSFLWKDNPEIGPQLGLIAQDVQPVVRKLFLRMMSIMVWIIQN